ncbi:MAG: hypothetical protein D6722_13000 [Bacteroidetes bacterium]|nr:MAG: hypothetical protein D6722_13000 [Bacteroidota bacterium]
MSPVYRLRLLLAALAALGAAVAFLLWQPGAGGPQAQLLMPPPPDLLQTWRWVQTYDPYESGHMIQATDTAARYLAFRPDGTLLEQTPAQRRQGQWRHDAQQDALALLFGTVAQGRPAATLRPWQYRHEIIHLTDGELVLAWQGRHGKVQEWYQAVDSLPAP